MLFLLFFCVYCFFASLSLSIPHLGPSRPHPHSLSVVLILNEMQNNASRHFEFSPSFPGSAAFAVCSGDSYTHIYAYVRILWFHFFFFSSFHFHFVCWHLAFNGYTCWLRVEWGNAAAFAIQKQWTKAIRRLQIEWQFSAHWRDMERKCLQHKIKWTTPVPVPGPGSIKMAYAIISIIQEAVQAQRSLVAHARHSDDVAY